MFSIRTPLLVTQTAAAVADQDRTAMALRDQRAQSRQVNDLATHLVAVSQAKTESIKARIATIDSQIGTANALLERMQSLVEQGFAAKIQVDNQKIAVDTLRRNREEAALELIAAESETSLSAGGSLRTDFTTSVQTRATMRARVNEADAAVRANESNINALDNATRILSPCDCVVHAVMATPGDVVEAGTLVYALRPRSTAPEVDALFSAQRGHELRSGATAVIALPDRWVRGRVRSMSYLAGNSARIGLPQKVDAATGDSGQQLATATIVPDEPIDAALIGSPVTAYIASNPFGSLGAHIATLFH
jgi:biotin carboxyl carrier protein